ncbi:GFA family protein [Sinorhizobium sp. 7-81]|uniref:GFA family protein n=1 Tax=Sinorhizobium sp. 8-89 TaxID=3049089 RepID=UPI0024C41AD0|nr:GFA family protein [Sinorhizobium sp. 8-89]MDK1491906.1 GFA family protein [Sinorhizobium sp. 8-89]
MGTRTGGCLCGAVRYQVSGEPLRVGLCHCADCRKESGSSFVTFAVWSTRAFSSSGKVKVFAGRGFCPVCGSRLFNPGEEEIEIRVGSLDDAPAALRPQYEIWVTRREPWLHSLSVQQFLRDRVL